jgi:hypothetical protein
VVRDSDFEVENQAFSDSISTHIFIYVDGCWAAIESPVVGTPCSEQRNACTDHLMTIRLSADELTSGSEGGISQMTPSSFSMSVLTGMTGSGSAALYLNMMVAVYCLDTGDTIPPPALGATHWLKQRRNTHVTTRFT